MNFTQKGKLAGGCNWAMAGTAIAFSGYVFVQLFSVPPQSPVVRTSVPVPAAAALVPAPPAPTGSVAARPALTTPAAPVPPAAAGQPAPAATAQNRPSAPAPSPARAQSG